jgi:hypothetical protein
MAGLDRHFLQELFDCSDVGKAASLATMMQEELLDVILESATSGMIERQQLRECTLPQKIELAARLRVVDDTLIGPMRYLMQLHQRPSKEVTTSDYQALTLPDLDLELRKCAEHQRVTPAIQINVALCHLLVRLADHYGLSSDHDS